MQRVTKLGLHGRAQRLPAAPLACSMVGARIGGRSGCGLPAWRGPRHRRAFLGAVQPAPPAARPVLADKGRAAGPEIFKHGRAGLVAPVRGRKQLELEQGLRRGHKPLGEPGLPQEQQALQHEPDCLPLQARDYFGFPAHITQLLKLKAQRLNRPRVRLRQRGDPEAGKGAAATELQVRAPERRAAGAPPESALPARVQLPLVAQGPGGREQREQQLVRVRVVLQGPLQNGNLLLGRRTLRGRPAPQLRRDRVLARCGFWSGEAESDFSHVTGPFFAHSPAARFC